MSQTSFKAETGKEQALVLQKLLEQTFEEEGFPVSGFENMDKPDEWEVGIYVPTEQADEIHTKIKSAMKTARTEVKFVREDLPETDWVSMTLRELVPVRAGRFIVHGSHDRDAPRPHETAIEIDAGLAFGTGHHGTTAGCLDMLDRVLKRKSFFNALDLGTGSGVLAIAIAKATEAHVLASDIDPTSTITARENTRKNGTHAQIECITAAGFSHPRMGEQAPFDLVIANILARPLQAMALDISLHTAKGGTVILSGLLPHQRSPIIARFRSHGLHLQHSHVRDGWLVLVFEKP